MGKFYILISYFAAGANLPLMKLGLRSITPELLLFIRFFGATLVFLPFYLKKGYSFSIKYLKEPVFSSVFLCLALFFIAFGVNGTSVSNTQAILSLSVVLIVLGGAFIYKEKITTIQYLGLLLGFAGVFTIVGSPNIYENHLVFDLIVFLAAIFAAVHVLVTKKYVEKYGSTTMTFAQFITASIFFGGITIFNSVFKGVEYKMLDLTFTDVSVLLYLIIIGTFVIFYTYLLGIERVTASFVGYTRHVSLVVSIVLGSMMFDETLSFEFVLGAVAVIASAVICGRNGKKVKETERSSK